MMQFGNSDGQLSNLESNLTAKSEIFKDHTNLKSNLKSQQQQITYMTLVGYSVASFFFGNFREKASYLQSADKDQQKSSAGNRTMPS